MWWGTEAVPDIIALFFLSVILCEDENLLFWDCSQIICTVDCDREERLKGLGRDRFEGHLWALFVITSAVNLTLGCVALVLSRFLSVCIFVEAPDMVELHRLYMHTSKTFIFPQEMVDMQLKLREREKRNKTSLYAVAWSARYCVVGAVKCSLLLRRFSFMSLLVYRKLEAEEAAQMMHQLPRDRFL